MFADLYQWMRRLAEHRRATYCLGAVSFAESSFFPLPPDIMLIPMVLVDRNKAWFLATLTTLASVAGGVLGYMIGAWGIDALTPTLVEWGLSEHLQRVYQLFAQYGILIVLLAGFTPIPYKIFSIAAGATSLSLLPFVLISLVGRGGRFFLVAFLVRRFGQRTEALLTRYVEPLGWGAVALVTLYIGWKWWN